MLTYKFNISISEEDKKFVLDKQVQYSCAVRKLYKNFNKISDSEYGKYIQSKFNLQSYELACARIDATTKFNQTKTQKDKISNQIISIQKEINILNNINNLKKKETRKLFKLNKLLILKEKSLSKDITFGNLNLLKQISFLNNDKDNNKELIETKTKLYKSNRILFINYVGEARVKNSNRYFKFDFLNDFIIYTPNRNTKINIQYKVSKNIKDKLIKLQEIKDNQVLPISIKLSTKELIISFDESKLNGFEFKQKEYYEAIKEYKGDSYKELRKDIYKEFIKEQEDRIFKDKIKDRYCAIDLNPDYIGVSILDKNKIIDKFCFNLKDLLKKSNKSSTNKDSIYLNNKRKYEIGCIYKYLFKIIKHYKVANFIIEDLNFKSLSVNEFHSEFNRKTKNVWNLNYQLNLIKKHINENGLKLIEVNPCYSSFIGNIMFVNFDPINASLEIGRRGINKYIKGNSFYPHLTETIKDTVIERFNIKSESDVLDIKGCENMVSLYKLINKMGCKYRWQLKDIDTNSFKCFSINNKKSNWNLYSF